MKALKLLVLLVIAASAMLAVVYGPVRDAWHRELNRSAIDYYKSNMSVFHQRVSRNLPSQAVVFYGDSLIQGLAVQSVTPLAVNFGIGHARVDDVLHNLRAHSGLSEAGAIVLGVGINDVLVGEPGVIEEGYRRILEVIPGNAPIIVSLMLPVDENIVRQAGVNKTVDQINTLLSQFCERDPRVKCLSWSEELTLATGQLKPQFHIGDGLHLNAEGNRLWIQHLREIIQEVE